MIHRRTEAVVKGMNGFLIWDFILYNEITFQSDDGIIISFFRSISDDETEVEWLKPIDK